MFKVGMTYKALLNGTEREFTVLDSGDHEFAIRWDDGDEEWAYVLDMKRWVNDLDNVLISI